MRQARQARRISFRQAGLMMSVMRRGRREVRVSREVELVGLSSTKHREKSKALTVSCKMY